MAQTEPTMTPPPADDPLDALRERIRRTEEAAERLRSQIAEAASATTRPDAPQEGAAEHETIPPRGWASAAPGGQRDEFAALVVLIDALRSLVPAELQQQVAELVRELLLAVRALIDWYLERVEARRSTPVEVEDIPID